VRFEVFTAVKVWICSSGFICCVIFMVLTNAFEAVGSSETMV
jgi:hypothetical protein